MLTQPQILDAVDTGGNGLRVVFFWDDDRYAHRVERLRVGIPKVLAESLEGSDQTPWPPSAPLQQLSIEDRPGGCQVALLVGMSGHSHWSASITSAPQRSLLFEMACRTKEPTAILGSSYRIAFNLADIATKDGVLQFDDVALSSTSTNMQLNETDNTCELRVPRSEIAGVTTIQWAYQFCWPEAL